MQKLDGVFHRLFHRLFFQVVRSLHDGSPLGTDKCPGGVGTFREHGLRHCDCHHFPRFRAREPALLQPFFIGVLVRTALADFAGRNYYARLIHRCPDCIHAVDAHRLTHVHS